MKETKTHIYFLGGYLSNFHECSIKLEPKEFNSSEQLFMYVKALYFNDDETAEEILKTSEPQEAKKLGRQVKNFNTEFWNNYCYEAMFKVNLAKFDQNPELAEKLIATYPKILVEANEHDCIWGVGLSEDNPLILDESNWKGSNLLGKALMDVRKELMNK